MYGLTPEQKKAKKPKPEKREKRWTKAEQKSVNFASYQTAPATNEETHFRHEHWKAARIRIRKIITQCATTQSRLDAWDNCGSECTVEYCKEREVYRLRANYCKNRNCRPCMKAKGNLLAANLEKKVTDLPGKQFRFITLTLKHCDAPLKDQLDRLNASFKKLRNHPCWKKTQTGGAAMLECKFSRDTWEWHPHLHIVAEGYYLDQKELSDAWYSITKDSFKVDIRVIKSARDAAFYVAKYVSKGVNDDVWYDDYIAQEWVCTMKGRRLCATYGSWRGFKLLAHLPDTDKWTTIATLTTVYREASRGEHWAIKLIDNLRHSLQYNPHQPRKKIATTI